MLIPRRMNEVRCSPLLSWGYFSSPSSDTHSTPGNPARSILTLSLIHLFFDGATSFCPSPVDAIKGEDWRDLRLPHQLCVSTRVPCNTFQKVACGYCLDSFTANFNYHITNRKLTVHPKAIPQLSGSTSEKIYFNFNFVCICGICVCVCVFVFLSGRASICCECLMEV